MLALDHLLYGVVVAGRLAPENAVGSRFRDRRSEPPRRSSPDSALGGIEGAILTGELDELAEDVVRARLRLLDPRDVVGAGDDHVVGEASAATRPPS